MKKNPIHPDGFFDDFFDWFDSKDGQTSMQANDDVADALEGAELDVGNRKSFGKMARDLQ